MNILYITHKIPYPLSDGGKLRAFNHIKHISKKNKIVSLSFIGSKDELKNTDELKKYCKVETVLLPKWKSLINSFLGLFSRKPLRVWYLKDTRFRKKAKRLGKEADLVIVQALRMSQYGFYPKKTIVDVVDTPSLQIKRAIKHDNSIWKAIWKIELPRILNYEKGLCKKFDRIIIASKDDKNALGKGIVVKNGIDIKKVKRKEVKENNIMFLGNMEYQPNIDAVNYFVKKIFPLVKKEVKDAKFYIVGKNPAKIKKLASQNVIITGFVKDTGEYFSKCKVFVAPMRLGSGIQNKVLEAMNNEIPVVMTKIVNEGVEGIDGKEVMVAEKTKEFAEKIIMLLKDKELRKKVSDKGKRLLKKEYSWEKIYYEIDRIINIKGKSA